MIIGIHQPNFFPRMNFFEKMKEVDLFVLLTRVQYERQNFQNRFFYRGWNTMSVNAGLEPIRDKIYVNHTRDWKKITTRHPKLKMFDHCISSSLCFTNCEIIFFARKMLDIKTPVEFDSATMKTGSERLLEICQKHGATEYLSGIGGKKYLDVELFEKNGIKVLFQDEKTLDKRPLIDLL